MHKPTYINGELVAPLLADSNYAYVDVSYWNYLNALLVTSDTTCVKIQNECGVEVVKIYKLIPPNIIFVARAVDYTTRMSFSEQSIIAPVICLDYILENISVPALSLSPQNGILCYTTDKINVEYDYTIFGLGGAEGLKIESNTLLIKESAAMGCCGNCDPVKIPTDIFPQIVTLSPLPNHQVNTYYSCVLVGSGGKPPYSWDIVGGELPHGVELSPSGILYGLPDEEKTSTFTVRLTDINGIISLKSFILIVADSRLKIVGNMPDGILNAATVYAYTVTGGVPPYTVSVVNGAMPTGVSINTDGVASGTFTATGRYSWTMRVTDSSNDAATLADVCNVTIPSLKCMGTFLDSYLGTSLGGALYATGGIAPYAVSVVAGASPTGVSFSVDGTGKVVATGALATSGVYSWTLRITSTDGQFIEAPQHVQVYQLDTSCDAYLNKTSCLIRFDGTNGDSNIVDDVGNTWTNVGVTVTNEWSEFGGTSGKFLGTGSNYLVGPSTIFDFGTADFTVEFTAYLLGYAPSGANCYILDTRPSATVGNYFCLYITNTGSFRLYVNGAHKLIGTTFNAYTKYRVIVQRVNGVTSFIVNGGVTSSVSDTTNYISGNVIIGHKSDQLSNSNYQYNGYIDNIRITKGIARYPNTSSIPPAAPFSTEQCVVITGDAPDADENVQYNYAYSITGKPPYTTDVSSGSLPAGLILSDQFIAGIPNTPGIYEFTVKATDSNGHTYVLGDSINIHAVVAPLDVSGAAPNGEVNVAYGYNYTIEHGVPPYSVAVQSGTLPNGLSVSDSGVLSGIPTTVGTFNFTLLISDSAANTKTLTDSIDIVAVELSGNAPDTVIGDYYSYQYVASGIGPFTWSVDAGTLPNGLSLDLLNGKITGTPTKNGTFSYIIKITNINSVSATLGDTIAVANVIDPLVIVGNCPDSIVNTPVTYQYNSSGGVPPYTYAITSGALPTGLTLNSSNGLLSGVPTAEGAYSWTVTVTDSANTTSSLSDECTISPSINSSVILGGRFDFDSKHNFCGLKSDGNIDTGVQDIAINATIRDIIQSTAFPGQMYIAGYFTSVNGEERIAIARLSMSGTLDNNFIPPKFNGYILSVTELSNGKLIVSGFFTRIDNGPDVFYGVARLNSDGSIDDTFAKVQLRYSKDKTLTPGPEAISSTSIRHTVLSDGRILVYGTFTEVAGLLRCNIARLSADGSLDTSFVSPLELFYLTNPPSPGYQPNIVTDAKIQNDGKIILAGVICPPNRAIHGPPSYLSVRLLPDGAIDSTYSLINAPGQRGSEKYGACILSNGEIILYSMMDNALIKVSSTGSIITNWSPKLQLFYQGMEYVPSGYCVKVDIDGKLLVAGQFNKSNGVDCSNLTRLNADGTTDPYFDSTGMVGQQVPIAPNIYAMLLH